eukprot:gene6462-8031_t
MADCWDAEKRSAVMARVRSKGNRSTEVRMIKLLREFGITGWRRNQKIYGRPDFVFRKARIAVFIDGCFWHYCPECYRRPKSNQEFWDNKVRKNHERDQLVNFHLRQAGWKVFRVWEHQLRQQEVAVTAKRLSRLLAR